VGDFFEDWAGRPGPDEGLGVSIVVVQVFHDGVLEFGDALEGATANPVSSGLCEEPLDHGEPGGRGRCEVKARMTLEPALHGRGFVSSVVVNDEMKVKAGRGLLVDQFKKAQELTMSMSMAWHAGTRPSNMFSGVNKVVVPSRL
jgi:hypothetical protein